MPIGLETFTTASNPTVGDRRLDPYLSRLSVCCEPYYDPTIEPEDPVKTSLRKRQAISHQQARMLITHYLIREDIFEIDELLITSITSLFEAFTKHIRFLTSENEMLKNADPVHICVVCVENQGRSQMFEKFIKDIADSYGLRINIISRGDRATPEKYDGKPNRDVRQKMKKIRHPIDDATVDQFTQIDIDDNTILVILDDSIVLQDWAYRSLYILRRNCPDPFPGIKKPRNLDSALTKIASDAAVFALAIVFGLTDCVLNRDPRILETYFTSEIVYKSSRLLDANETTGEDFAVTGVD